MQRGNEDISSLEQERTFLMSGLKTMGISVDGTAIDDLLRFYSFLKSKNRAMNLTGLNQYKDILSSLFLDSLALIPYLDKLKIHNILDVGTGSGFPGLPLKIARPHLTISLLDSSKKKLGFCQLVALSLGLKNVSILEGRAEVFSKKPEYFERFDLVCSKAVASFSELIKLCMPFVMLQGLFVAFKSRNHEKEIEGIANLLQSFNSKISDIKKVDLPETPNSHFLIFVEKVGKIDNNPKSKNPHSH